MDRFYNEDPDNEKSFFGSHEDDEDEEDLYELEEQTIAFIQSQDLFQIMQASLAHDELKTQILNKSIKVAEKHWLWKFKSSSSKIQEIAIIYQSFMIMTEDPPVMEED
jgi:hypothetical protein